MKSPLHYFKSCPSGCVFHITERQRSTPSGSHWSDVFIFRPGYYLALEWMVHCDWFREQQQKPWSKYDTVTNRLPRPFFCFHNDTDVFTSRGQIFAFTFSWGCLFIQFVRSFTHSCLWMRCRWENDIFQQWPNLHSVWELVCSGAATQVLVSGATSSRLCLNHLLNVWINFSDFFILTLYLSGAEYGKNI